VTGADGHGSGGHRSDGHGDGLGRHERLSHLPDAALPAVYAARAALVCKPPAHADQLEADVVRFLAALSPALSAAGCTLVGHIKGSVTAPGRGDLTFHLTTPTARPALTGGFAGVVAAVTLTINVIVFGVDEQALPAIVHDAWSAATGAVAAWPD
jgi:hypothetical protein